MGILWDRKNLIRFLDDFECAKAKFGAYFRMSPVMKVRFAKPASDKKTVILITQVLNEKLFS